jgi:large subunit ribosomal protein L10
MDRTTKEQELAFLRDALNDVQGLVLTSVKGLTVAEVSDLRRRLHDAGVQYRVVKNTLAKKAIEGTAVDVVSADFKEETAIAWSTTDAVTPAKVVVNFKKDVEKFQIKSGYTSGQRMDEAAVTALSKLPSLDELRAQILGVLLAVPGKLVRQVNAPGQQLAAVIQARVEKEKDAA